MANADQQKFITGVHSLLFAHYSLRVVQRA